MRLALEYALRGLGRCAPNPSVGAVVTRGEGAALRIVSAATTAPGGRPHAEPQALAAAGAAARGATLHVTLEPCLHVGGTEPCTDAIVAAGIARLEYGAVDADPRMAGKGLARLAAAGIVVQMAAPELAAEAARIACGHTLRLVARRPYVIVKLAAGADGRIPAGGAGKPVFVSGPASLAYAHRLRAEVDAVMVGSGTLTADDPALTCRLPGMTGRTPIRIVIGAQAIVPPEAKLRCGRSPVWRIVEKGFARDDDTTIAVPVGPAGLDLATALAKLAARGVTRILVEGGPRLATSFATAGLIDECALVTAALPAGESGHILPDGLTSGLVLAERRRLGEDELALWHREAACSPGL